LHEVLRLPKLVKTSDIWIDEIRL